MHMSCLEPDLGPPPSQPQHDPGRDVRNAVDLAVTAGRGVVRSQPPATVFFAYCALDHKTIGHGPKVRDDDVTRPDARPVADKHDVAVTQRWHH